MSVPEYAPDEDQLIDELLELVKPRLSFYQHSYGTAVWWEVGWCMKHEICDPRYCNSRMIFGVGHLLSEALAEAIEHAKKNFQ